MYDPFFVFWVCTGVSQLVQNASTGSLDPLSVLMSYLFTLMFIPASCSLSCTTSHMFAVFIHQLVLLLSALLLCISLITSFSGCFMSQTLLRFTLQTSAFFHRPQTVSCSAVSLTFVFFLSCWYILFQAVLFLLTADLPMTLPLLATQRCHLVYYTQYFYYRNRSTVIWPNFPTWYRSAVL